MSTNGQNGVKENEPLQWRIGLINYENKYMTAETFGFKINASANSLKKKQVWTLEHSRKDEAVVYLRSHLGRYLSTDKNGNVKCDSETKGPDEQFCVQYSPDGKWAIKSYTHNYYFGGSADTLRCYDVKSGPGPEEWWIIHLAVHPQVNLWNVNRRRYCHLKDDQLQCNEIIPWGKDALITIGFFEGKYAVQTADNRYLSRSGELVGGNPSKDSLYTLEIKSGHNPGIALKDCTGKYLTAVGQNAVMQARNKVISKDELFVFEDSRPQAFFTAHNGKKISIKQGVDLTANQDELTDCETFQMEFDRASQKWRLRTVEDKYWSLEQACGIQAVAKTPTESTLFDIEYQPDGSLVFKAQNNKYVTARKNGSLYAVCDTPSETEQFFLSILNRPLLVLRCDFGFVGFKTPTNPRVECNKSVYDIIYMDHSQGKDAAYYFKGTNGKFWSVAEDGMINADSDQPQPFQIELKSLSKFVIKAPNGLYIKGEQNGIFQAKEDLEKATLWEY